MVLTGSVTCALNLATPSAGAQPLCSEPRTPVKACDLVPLLETGLTIVFVVVLELSLLLCADERLHRERVSLEAHGARGPPFFRHATSRRDAEVDKYLEQQRVKVHLKCMCRPECAQCNPRAESRFRFSNC